MDKKSAKKCVSKYRCEKCNYNTLRNFDFRRHNMSALHKKKTNDKENCADCVDCITTTFSLSIIG